MDFLRHRSKSFIIRIWIEPREIENETPVWRGTVEEVDESKPGDSAQHHLPQRMAYSRISDLISFLTQRMKQLGIPEDQINRQ